MSGSEHKDPVRVAGGLKATINNPNVSEEAKIAARERLEGMDFDETSQQSTTQYGGEELTSNQLGGYKATLKNPRVSAEAKEHAREVIDANASDEYTSGQNEHVDYEDEHNNRVLGGYKATLKNPRVSDEAKEHAESILKDNDAI